jgi:hypothetical protein
MSLGGVSEGREFVICPGNPRAKFNRLVIIINIVFVDEVHLRIYVHFRFELALLAIEIDPQITRAM